MATSSIALINVVSVNSAFSHVAASSAASVSNKNKVDDAASKLIDTVTHGQAKITGSFKNIEIFNAS